MEIFTFCAYAFISISLLLWTYTIFKSKIHTVGPAAAFTLFAITSLLIKYEYAHLAICSLISALVLIVLWLVLITISSKKVKKTEGNI